MDVPVSRRIPERVYVLAASAGGHDALASLLAEVGNASRDAFVVAVKASEGPSMLLETLELHTRLRIVTVAEEERLEPGTVYLAPPGRHLTLGSKAVHSVPRDPGACTISHTLETFAASWGSKANVVVLAGGVAQVEAGTQAILAAGGSVYCQSPSTAPLEDMPVAVLRAVGASGVGTAAEIGGWIRDGVPAEVRDTGDPDRVDAPLPPMFWTLLEAVRVVMGVDLYAYRTATLYRRVLQRSRALGCDTVEAYVERALRDPAEIDELASRFLIGTTDFFRNEALFDDLRQVVVPAVAAQPTFAVWCAGCSTGEEAYSVAATLHDALRVRGAQTRLRILATDVRAEAIEFAAAGVYPLARVENMPAELRKRYGEQAGDHWRVGDELRDCVRFSVHDVLADPPPQDRDMVLFRNVMIYLRPDVHPRALARMHAALRPGGFLAVGESESTHSLEGAFARRASHGAMLHRV